MFLVKFTLLYCSSKTFMLPTNFKDSKPVWLKHFLNEPAPQNQHPAKFCVFKSCESRNKRFLNCHVTSRCLGSCGFKGGSFSLKSASCLDWCPRVYCKWRCNVFNLSLDLKRPPHWGAMRINGWELLIVCHHPIKFSDHRHLDGEDIYFASHMTSCDHMFKGLCEFMIESPSQ